MHPHHEIHPRDDGLFDVIVSGGIVAGPFETYQFAAAIAAGKAPEPLPSRARYFRVLREMRLA